MCLYFVGAGAQICGVTALTCCPLQVEQSIDQAAFADVKEIMPPFSIYLDESDANFFSHYGKIVSDITLYMYYAYMTT